MTDSRLSICCHGCGSAGAPRSAKRPPRGWKQITGSWLCARCLADRYLHRAVTVPIAGPLDATWTEFGAALRESWTQTTACANWIVSTLYARDVRRGPDVARLPPMPKVYLYPEARAQFPGIAPINLTAILQQVEQTYRRQRYELLWRGTRSLAVHRYPVPTPIHQQAWTLETLADGNGAIVLRVRLGDRWWRLRLRGGADFHRQRQQLVQLQAGAALPGAGALFAIRAHQGDHRHQETRQRVLVKLTGWFPRPSRRDATGTLTVRTAASDLLILSQPHRADEILAGDEIRRAIAAYDVRRVRAQWRRTTAGAAAAQRQANRIKSLCQQIGARVARIACVRGVATVAYEDEERGFCDPFPWTKFQLWLRTACESSGLTYIYLSGETATVTPLALAGSGGV